jgi:hypothetical protein
MSKLTVPFGICATPGTFGPRGIGIRWTNSMLLSNINNNYSLLAIANQRIFFFFHLINLCQVYLRLFIK